MTKKENFKSIVEQELALEGEHNGPMHRKAFDLLFEKAYPYNLPYLHASGYFESFCTVTRRMYKALDVLNYLPLSTADEILQKYSEYFLHFIPSAEMAWNYCAGLESLNEVLGEYMEIDVQVMPSTVSRHVRSIETTMRHKLVSDTAD